MALSLLLADDQPAIEKIISLSLPREEYEIRSVTSVKEAMDHIAAERPDFFLVDVSLRFDVSLDPAMNPDHPDIKKDGTYLTRYIKEHERLKSIQVIMLTNAFEPIDEDTRNQYLADAVLVKPFDPNELRTALRNLMSDSHHTKLQSGPATPDATPEDAPDKFMQATSEVLDRPIKIETSDQTDSDFSDVPDIDISQLSKEAQELSAFFSDEIAAANDPVTASDPVASANPDPLAVLPDSIDSAAEEWKPIHPTVEEDLSAWQQADNKSGDALFDTGGSNFSFQSDYIQKVKKLEEAREECAEQSRLAEHALLTENEFSSSETFSETFSEASPEVSSEASPSPASMITQQEEITKWIHESEDKLEALIREEIRKHCVKLIEKVAWDIIPELAENIIRKELKKILTALEKDPE